ncbi:MAG: thiamine-phosphate kinase [Planctomycetes bacterium]|nr:thiamine-phosphate kinase [Planctomycetota bacterium]
MGELSLIRQFRRDPPGHPWLKVGPGQDCAILRWGEGRDLAFKIDQVVEGTHFLLDGPEASSPRRIGWKAMAKACSDIAAAGCWPVAAAVAVNLNRRLDDAWAEELHAGLAACCARFNFALAGGDITTSNGAVTVCVSLLGEGPADGAWLRNGAKPGDWLLVTGELGGSRGGKHLDFIPRLEEARRIRALLSGQKPGAASPEPRVHACIDITDGLARDAGHLCEESRCGVEIDEAALPVSAAANEAAQRDGRGVLAHVLGDGEDFELLLAVEPQAAAALLKDWQEATPLRRVGTVLPEGAGRRLKHADGTVEPLPDVGYEHRTGGSS